jgi:hypothetical protein
MGFEEEDLMAQHLLVITAQGLLKRLQTPFKALVVVSVEQLEGNTIYLVSAVITEENEIMKYRINGRGYHYHYFIIVG